MERLRPVALQDMQLIDHSDGSVCLTAVPMAQTAQEGRNCAFDRRNKTLQKVGTIFGQC